MYRLCSTEKAVHQQRMLCGSFLSLLLTEDYDDITISHICAKANLSRNIFYRLFEKKVDVLYCLLDQSLLDCESYIPKSNVGEGGLHRFLAFWLENNQLLDALARNNSTALLLNRAVRHVLKEDSDLLQCFGAEDDKSARALVVFYVGGIFSLVFDWHQQGYPQSIDEMSNILKRILSTPPVKNSLQRNPGQFP